MDKTVVASKLNKAGAALNKGKLRGRTRFFGTAERATLVAVLGEPTDRPIDHQNRAYDRWKLDKTTIARYDNGDTLVW